MGNISEGDGDLANRKWLLFPCLAAIATSIYYATGHNSLLFNAIGLSSPALILAGFAREQRRSALRERVLREAGEALERATNREEIYRATVSAAESIAGDHAQVRLFVDARTATVLSAVGLSAAGSPQLLNQVDRLHDLTVLERDDILAGRRLMLRRRVNT
ncbi:MAG: hypothetical protein QOI44_1014, partial [Actinomycetota bacterium]|nr:hypothetical protein [Actinomycetota bacterium]